MNRALDVDLAGRARRLSAYVTKETAASEIGMSISTVWRRIEDGRFDVEREDGRTLISRRSLLAYIAYRDHQVDLADLPLTLQALGDPPADRKVVPLAPRLTLTDPLIGRGHS